MSEPLPLHPLNLTTMMVLDQRNRCGGKPCPLLEGKIRELEQSIRKAQEDPLFRILERRWWR